MLLLAVLLALAAPARGATPAEAIAALNAQRAANGLPAGIVENPAWSAACAAHVAYLKLNGYGDWHGETPGEPGYSEAGEEAAQGAVLSENPWAGAANPWEDAPIHLMQLLGPGLSVTGFADGCMFTWPGYRRPQPDALGSFSYPGEDAVISPAMTASEVPFVPGEFVGLPAGTRTGPYLYVFGWGDGTTGGRLSDVSLSGPGGAVDVRVVDNHTEGVGVYLPPGGIIIPVTPLRVDASYTAVARYTSDEGGSVLREWTFRTSALRRPEISVSIHGATLSAVSDSPAPGVVTLERLDDGATVGRWPLTASVDLPPGRYRVCVEQEASDAFLAVRECVEPDVALTLARVRGGRASATLRASGAAIGRRVRVRIVRLRTGRQHVRWVKLGRVSRVDVGPRPVKVIVSVRGRAVISRTQR